ncbi:MAG TPA: ATP-binding protein [Nannocystaceae bacterium]|nr:ATP-binding protein [Nannocystaceae bacterium]
MPCARLSWANVAENERAIESDELVRALFAAHPGGIVRIATGGQVLDANAEAARILGLRRDEIRGMFVAEWDTRVIDERGEEVPVAELPVSRTLGTGKPAGPVTLGVERPDGSVSWAVYYSVPLRDPSGATAGAIVTLLDVTDRVRAESELRRSEERWRSLFGSIPGFVILVDREGKLQTMNRTVAGIELREVIGSHFTQWMPPESATVVAERLAHVLATGETVVFEIRGAGEGGVIEWYEDVISPMRQGGEIVGGIIMARVVTARKRLEHEIEENRRLAAIGMLAAGVAHEINNPLTYILGNVAHALSQVEDPALVEVLEDARRGAERVGTIVGDLKLLSREPDEAVGPIDLAKVIDAALGIVDSELRHRATVVRAYVDMPPVRGNEVKLMQVALNLLVNAMQAMLGGEPHRHVVRIETRVADGRWGEMIVEDDGDGIPRDQLARVFEPFFTTKPAGLGTGLGLSICQGIVDSHGGSIAIASEEGRGTKVTVRLPLAEDTSVSAPAPAASQPAPRLRVLVIDDDAAVARTLMRMIGAAHDVELVHDGEEALAVLERARFDVVLCDVMMPRRSGVEIYERVRERDAEQASRFLMLTGGVFSPSLRARLDAHRLTTLGKPIDRATLLAAIAERAGRT